MRNWITKDGRGRVGEKLMELGNIAAGALLFGQAFSGFRFSYRLATVGLLTLLVMYAVALNLMRGGDH